MKSIEQIESELLVLRSQRGDVAAFDALIRVWQTPLSRMLNGLLGDTQGAGDVAQEVWMAVVRGLSRLDDPARFRPWLYRIAVHKAADWIRREQRRRRLDRDIQNQRPQTSWISPEDSEALWAAVRALPNNQKWPVTLVYGEGCSIEETAKILDCPTGTVKSRLSRARDALRASMLEDGAP